MQCISENELHISINIVKFVAVRSATDISNQVVTYSLLGSKSVQCKEFRKIGGNTQASSQSHSRSTWVGQINARKGHTGIHSSIEPQICHHVVAYGMRSDQVSWTADMYNARFLGSTALFSGISG